MKSLLVFVAFLACGPVGSLQDKVTLKYTATEGSVARYSSKLDATVAAAGTTVQFGTTITSKRTIVKVHPSGDIEFESQLESMKVTVNGEPMDDEETPSSSLTYVIRPNGSLVSVKSSDSEDDVKLQARIFQLTTPVFSDSPVGIGDSWTHSFKADPDLGTKNATASYKFEGREKIGNVEVAKLSFRYSDSGSAPNASASGTHWVELANGDSVRTEFKFSDLSLADSEMSIVGSGTGSGERASGGPHAAATEEDEKPKEKTVEEVVKGYEKIPGFVTLYRKREAGRTTLYMEIAAKQLERLMMLQTTASTGNSEQIVAGDPISDIVFKFSIRDEEKVFMVVPNFGFRAEASKPIARAVDRSFAESFLEAFKIEARDPETKSVLINVSDLFRGDISMINSRFSGPSLPIPGLGGGGFSLDRDKTYVSAIKNFPENLVVESVYNYAKSGSVSVIELFLQSGVTGDPRSRALRVNYNLWALPTDDGYVPRFYDPRVGYFTSDYRDFTNDKELDKTRRVIFRWRLEKQDPSAPVSPPKEPIVFWMDNAIPLEYRDAVRTGLLAWNEAFERAGFKDAVVVKQMPDDADFDHADMRFNTLRWVTSPEGGYAVALFRVNPLTGEIVNASITVDANIVSYLQAQKDIAVDPASFFDPPKRELHHPHACNHAAESRLNAAFGLLALRMVHPTLSAAAEKKYLDEFIGNVVAHEMGHIVGLRHNFIASTELTMEDLGDPTKVLERGTAASVMDYIPVNVAAIRNPENSFWVARVGEYDKWAVEYGYKPLGAWRPEDEVVRLRGIASQNTAPGRAYQTDEVADFFDPLVTRNDLSKRPIEYWTEVLRMTRHLAMNLSQRKPDFGESYWTFTLHFNVLTSMYVQAAAISSRYIGGLNLSSSFKGDPGARPPIVPVSGDDQRKALELLNRYVFAETAFEFPRDYYRMFTSNPNLSLAETLFSPPSSFPMLDRFAGIQRSALRFVLRGDVLGRVANNEYKAKPGEKPLTIAELFGSVSETVWSGIDSGRPVTPLRRLLQREHLDLLIQLVVSTPADTPADARLMGWSELRKLGNRLAAATRKATDAYTPVHIEESLMRVNRALAAVQTIGQPARSAPSLLEQLLGGSEKP